MTGGCDYLGAVPAALLHKSVTTRPARYRRQFWSDNFGPDSSTTYGDSAFFVAIGLPNRKMHDAAG